MKELLIYWALLTAGWLAGVLTCSLLAANVPADEPPQRGVPADEVCRFMMDGRGRV